MFLFRNVQMLIEQNAACMRYAVCLLYTVSLTFQKLKDLKFAFL